MSSLLGEERSCQHLSAPLPYSTYQILRWRGQDLGEHKTRHS